MILRGGVPGYTRCFCNLFVGRRILWAVFVGPRIFWKTASAWSNFCWASDLEGKRTMEANQIWKGWIWWRSVTRWWFQIFFYFHPYLGKISNFTTVIFFRWVETTNQVSMWLWCVFDAWGLERFWYISWLFLWQTIGNRKGVVNMMEAFLSTIRYVISLVLSFSPKDEFLKWTSPRWWLLKYFLFSPLPGEMIHFDEHIFQMGWFNHHLVTCVFLENKGGFAHLSGQISRRFPIVKHLERKRRQWHRLLWRRSRDSRGHLKRFWLASHKIYTPKHQTSGGIWMSRVRFLFSMSYHWSPVAIMDCGWVNCINMNCHENLKGFYVRVWLN